MADDNNNVITLGTYNNSYQTDMINIIVLSTFGYDPVFYERKNKTV